MYKRQTHIRIILVLVAIGLIFSSFPTLASARNHVIRIEFDGRTVPSDVAPTLVGNRALVPLRVVFEAIGATVTWNQREQSVTAVKGANTVVLKVGQRTATVNGASRNLEVPLQQIDERVMVPFRFAGEAFGANVEWDQQRRIIRINSTDVSRRRAPIASEMRLTTGGASFPFPLYSRLTAEYARITNPVIRIDYASVGSGAGIRGILGGTFDFAGSDAPLNAEQRAQVAPNEILHVPVVMGAVAVVYNVPGVGTGIRMTSDVLADIFLGTISNWNDARISANNPGVSFPNQRITVVRRADSSGTTFIFTDYLSAVSDAWRTGPGRGTTVNWPVGVGGRGNEGVSAQVSQIPGGIGYVELSHAFLNRLNLVSLRNRAGNFTLPTVEATTAAAAGLADEVARDTTTSLVNSPGANAYPIVGTTWILVHRDQANLDRAKVIVDFLRWAVLERNLEPFAADLFYAPLPQQVLNRVREQLQIINNQGNRIWR